MKKILVLTFLVILSGTLAFPQSRTSVYSFPLWNANDILHAGSTTDTSVSNAGINGISLRSERFWTRWFDYANDSLRGIGYVRFKNGGIIQDTSGTNFAFNGALFASGSLLSAGSLTGTAFSINSDASANAIDLTARNSGLLSKFWLYNSAFNYWAENGQFGTRAVYAYPTSANPGMAVFPYGTSAGNTGSLGFVELAANGTNYVGFKAPDNIPSSLAWVLPSGDGTSNQVLKTDGSGALGWATVNAAFLPSDVAYRDTPNVFTQANAIQGALTLGLSHSASGGIYFEDAGSSNNVLFTPASLSANRTLYLPNASGTLMTVDGGQTVTSGTWNGSMIDVTHGGTGTSTQFTAGSLVYAGSSGIYRQSNANLFYDSTNNRLGIGTNSPANPITISSAMNGGAAGSGTLILTGSTNKERIEIDTYGGSSTSPVYQGKNVGGSSSSPTSTPTNATLVSVAGAGYDTASSANKASMDLKSDTTWSVGNNGTRIEWSVTPNGSTTRSVAMTLHNTGNLSIGASTSPSMFNVGTSNQFQLNSSGIPVKSNNISLEGFGYPSQTDTVSSSNNSSNITATNLNNTGADGMYMVWVYIFCTTSDGSGASVTAKIDWDNNTKSTTSSSVAFNSTNNYATIVIPVHNKPVSSSSVRYSTTVTGSPSSAKYEIDITCVRNW